MSLRSNVFVFGLAAAGALCSHAGAATIFVSPCGNNAWAGLNPACAAPVGPKRTIQAAINAAGPGDFVHVLPGTYVEKIDLDGKAITLLGTGGAAATIIDGGNTGTVVTMNSLEGPSTIVRGFTMRNGNAASGGGMLIALANPTVEECIIRENFADDLGAGVACVAASPTFTDCQFIQNEADVAGADDDGWGAGLSVNGGSPSFTGCEFTGNGANDGGGGAIVTSASPTFTDCRFENNAQWTYCVAEPCVPPRAGSAVLGVSASPVFEGCDFVQNYTGGHGAVAVSGGSAEFVSCDFTENWSVFTPDPGQHGGALAGQQGAELTLIGCSFTDNQSNNSAGAIHLQNSSMSATLCGFSGNIANGGRGGGIHALGSTVALSACTLLQNLSKDGGGGIAVNAGSLGVSGSTFSGNATGNDAVPRGDISIIASGGAIEAVDAYVEVSSSTFTGNTSQYKGGAISRNPGNGPMFNDPLVPDLVVENSTFESNVSYFGGGIDIGRGVAHISGSVFESNEAMTAGGDGVGGGLRIGDSAFARVADSEFLSNTGAIAGGGIGCSGNMDGIGLTFTGNSAPVGGGVYAATNNTIANIYSSRFNLNSASEHGAAAYLGAAAGINLINCIVHQNTSPVGSAAIVAGQAGTSIRPLRVTNCTIHFNSGGGGVITTAAAIPVYVSNSIVWGHTGPEIALFQGAVEYSNVQGGYPGNGNINANPVWVGALGGNYRLNPASPCIDAGRTMALPQDGADLDGDLNQMEYLPLDYEGNPRVSNNMVTVDTGCAAAAVVDMGAFETAGVGVIELMPGDANADGFVTFADITYVLVNWGPCTPCCPGDVDGNGEVGFSDVTMVLVNWS